MIHQTVAYLNGLLKAVKITPNLYGITELEVVKDRDGNELVAPLAYVSNGNFDEVRFEETSIYHRVTGVSREEAESDVGCGLNITETASMKLVCFFDKDIYNTDDANITYKIGNNIANTISASNIKSLATALQVDFVEVVISDINLDKRSIFGEEFDGIEYTMPSELGVVSIDYEIRVSGDEACFLSYGCDDEPLDIRQLIIDEYCTNIGGNVLIESYITTASATQTFTEFIGYDLDNMYINLQGAGNMGHLSGLTAARKMITAWDNTTGVMTFKSALSSGYQITIIGTN